MGLSEEDSSDFLNIMVDKNPDTKSYLTVLIADDEPAIRNGIKNAINWDSLGLKIASIVSDGTKAYEEICRLTPDIAITDIMMSGMSGLELIARTKDKGFSTHFIILSGYDDFSYAKEAITLEVDDFLLKPLSKSELIDTLNKTISKIKISIKNAIEYKSLSDSARKNTLRKLASGEIRDKDEIEYLIDNHNSHITALLIQKNREDISLDGLLSETLTNTEYESFMWSKKITALLLYCDAEYARHIANIIVAYAEEKKLPIRLALGSTVSEIKSFKESFQTAMTAISYQIYDTDKIIYSSSNIIGTPPPPFSPNDVDMHGLIHMMSAKDEISIAEWVKAFFSRLMYVETPPPSYIKGMCIYLLTDLTRTLSHEKHISADLMPKIDYQEINEFSFLDDIEKWIISQIEYMKNISIPESEIANDPIIFKARKLINDSLGFQLSAQTIANELNMNFTYFSSYYKQKTGENISSYISRLKNDYAKKLLDDPQLSIEEISLSIGYTDYRSFYRNFKKTNGITPSQYRTRK